MITSPVDGASERNINRNRLEVASVVVGLCLGSNKRDKNTETC